MTDDLSDIIATLQERRDDHLKSIATLERAIAELSSLIGIGTSTEPVPPAVRRSVSASSQRSVAERILALADEQPRNWSAEEIIAEYAVRGEPFDDIQDPQNATYSALSRLTRDGAMVRTERGRYRSSKWHSQSVQDTLPGAPVVPLREGDA